jgi:phosphatidylinositol alpha-mannosyltransferase
VDPNRPGASSILRIALVCPYSLSRPGGVQGQVLGLARGLGGRGLEVTVFAPADATAGVFAPSGGTDGFDLVATGRAVALPANGSVAPVSLSVTAVVRAVRALRSGCFDIVHVHEPFTPGVPYGLLVARGLPPLVGTFHRSGGSPFYTALRPLTRRLVRRYAVRCAVSEAARATAHQALGGHYELAFNGVELDRYRDVDPWPTDRPTVLFLGRHEERKGLAVLLSAFDRFRSDHQRSGDRGPTPVLWVAGDGPETGTLRRLHPDSAHLRWLGVIAEEEKVRRLVAADILCAPSLGGESFGMVLLEAMAARTAVVASDIAGYRDAAGGHARLVPPGDVTALAGALAAECPPRSTAPPTDVERSARLEQAHAWASHWSMGRLSEWYENIYVSAMVRAGP